MGAENPPVGFGCSIAVVVGIDEYTHIRRLNTAVSDATRLATLLNTEHGYTNVITLTEEVTRERLCALFADELPGQIGPGDRLLFYFAGHGIALDGEDGPEGYLIPQDARSDDRNTFLAMAELYGWLEALPCRHLLAIFDCCFAGAFNWYRRRNVRPVEDMLYREHYDRFVREPAWQVLTSAAYDQEALDVLAGKPIGERGEHGNDGIRHSPFAHALFEALAGAGDLIPKGGGDGVVTATELYLYLRQAVEVQAEAQANHAQTPELWPFSRQKHGKGEYIFLVPGRGEPALPTAPPLSDENNPYRGLEPYNEEHAHLFFGRAGQVQQLAGQVATHPLTVVLGASGTGKSSLVKAGLLPMLRQQAEASLSTNGYDTASLFVLPPFRPGDAPLRVFAEQLTTHLGEPMQPEPTAIAQTIRRWLAAHPEQTLLLVVDQCEELITLSRSDDECSAFLVALSALLAQHAERLRIVLTLRTDFEPQFANTPLTPHWQAARFVVTPLSRPELREVIELPAAQRVLFLDPPELVDHLIDEVIQAPGALPLLSFTLSELYRSYLQRQERSQLAGELVERTLTEADYRALGGVIGSLRTRADAIFDNLDEGHRATMQRVMLRMVAVEGGELARRRVLRSELEYASEEENQRVATVLQQMVDARLLVTDSTDADSDSDDDETIEPAHDALVRAWDKLLFWKRAADEYLPLQRRLTLAANEWAQADEKVKTGLLWNNNPRLPQLQQVILPQSTEESDTLNVVLDPGRYLWPSLETTSEPTWLNRLEIEFVQKSIQRRARLLQRVIGITFAVVLILSGLTIFAFNQLFAAQRNLRTSLSRELAAQSLSIRAVDHELSLLLAIEAGKSSPTFEASNALRSWFTHQGRATYMRVAHREWLIGAAVDPAWTRLATYGSDQAAKVWDVQTGAELATLRGHTGKVSQAVWDGDGAHIATVGDDGTVRIWDAATGHSLRVLGNQTEMFETIAWSTTGNDIATVDVVGSVRVWDAQTGEPRLTLPTDDGPATLVVWSQNGALLATAHQNHKINLWNGTDGALVTQLSGHQRPIRHIEWNQAGTRLLSAALDGTVRVWDTSSGEPQLFLQIPSDPSVYAAQWSPTEKYIATTTIARVHVWDALSGALVTTLESSNLGYGLVSYVRWHPDSTKIATGSLDGSVWFWTIPDGNAVTELTGHTERVNFVAWNPNGAQIITTSEDGLLRLWQTSAGAEVRLLRGHTGQINQVAWNHAGDRLLTVGSDSSARVWDAANGRTLFELKIDHWFASLGWDKSGEQLLHAEQDQFKVWDSATGDLLAEVPPSQGQSVRTGVWNATGDAVAVLYDDGTVVIYYTQTATSIQLDTILGNGAYRLQWDPTGTYLLTIDEVGRATLWESKTGQLYTTLTDELNASGFTTWIAAWRPNGKQIAIIDATLIQVWDVANPARPVGIRYAASQPRDLVWSHRSAEFVLIDQEGSNSGAGFATIWDARTGELITSFSPPLGSFTSIVWSMTDEQLVTGGDDTSVRIWEATTGKAVATIGGHDEAVTSVDVSPNGVYIASASLDGTVRIHRLRIADLQDKACNYAVRNMSEAEWHLHMDAETPYRRTCDHLPLHPSFYQVARRLAREGEVDAAVAEYRRIHALAPDQPIDPVSEAARYATQGLIDQGLAAAATGRIDEAVGHFQTALALDPTLPGKPDQLAKRLASRSFFQQGVKAALAGEPEAATAHFEQAQQLNGDHSFDAAQRAAQLVSVNLRQQSEEMLARSQVEAAIDLLTQAATLDPTSAAEIAEQSVRLQESLLYFERGAAVDEEGDDAQAIVAYTQALALNLRYGDAYLSRGDAYYALRSYEAAIADYGKALELRGLGRFEEAIVYTRRGNTYRLLKRYDEALRDYELALERNPSYLSVYTGRARVYEPLTEYASAIQDYSTALELDPAYTWAFVQRGHAYLNLENYTAAIDDYTAAIALEDEFDYQWAYANRGFAYLQLGDYPAAIADLTQAITLDPEYAWAFANRAKAYQNLDEFEQAVADYSAAITIEPAYTWAYSNRAYVYMQQGQVEEALDDFRRVAELGPDSAAFNALCWYGSLMGFAADVLAACEQAVTLADVANIAGRRDSRGLARALTGDMAGAIEDFEFYVHWTKQNGGYDEYGVKREGWIAALKKENNPFNQEVLAELYTE